MVAMLPEPVVISQLKNKTKTKNIWETPCLVHDWEECEELCEELCEADASLGHIHNKDICLLPLMQHLCFFMVHYELKLLEKPSWSSTDSRSSYCLCPLSSSSAPGHGVKPPFEALKCSFVHFLDTLKALCCCCCLFHCILVGLGH